MRYFAPNLKKYNFYADYFSIQINYSNKESDAQLKFWNS